MSTLYSQITGKAEYKQVIAWEDNFNKNPLKVEDEVWCLEGLTVYPATIVDILEVGDGSIVYKFQDRFGEIRNPDSIYSKHEYASYQLVLRLLTNNKNNVEDIGKKLELFDTKFDFKFGKHVKKDETVYFIDNDTNCVKSGAFLEFDGCYFKILCKSKVEELGVIFRTYEEALLWSVSINANKTTKELNELNTVISSTFSKIKQAAFTGIVLVVVFLFILSIAISIAKVGA